MRARDLDLPPGAGADVGLAHDLVGIGDVADRAVERFAALPDGTFVWTRRRTGSSIWDEVPAAVAATFARGGRNLQRTHDAVAERLTAELWATGGPARR